MVLDCAVTFPLTDTEKAAARHLEARIDTILRRAARGEQAPILRDKALYNQRIRAHLVSAYALAGWTVDYSNREPTLRFTPNLAYHAHYGADVVALMRDTWPHQ